MPVTPLFAAIFALAYLYLTTAVIKLRMSGKVAIGVENNDSSINEDLQKAVRIHANFIEYVPIALILFWFLENITYSPNTVFWLGCILLIARLAHVIGMQNHSKYLFLRKWGVIVTLAVIAFSSIKIIWWYLPISI